MSKPTKKTITSILNKRSDVEKDKGTAKSAKCQPAKKCLMAEAKTGAKKKRQIYNCKTKKLNCQDIKSAKKQSSREKRKMAKEKNEKIPKSDDLSDDDDSDYGSDDLSHDDVPDSDSEVLYSPGGSYIGPMWWGW